MSTAAWMLGDPGRSPFAGHLRIHESRDGAWLAAAGRIAAGAPLNAAWAASRAVALALEHAARTGPGGDRYGLLRGAWAALAAQDTAALGPDAGADLSLLLVAGDAAGVSVTGVGLSACWGRAEGRWRALVDPGHPLLAPAGLPAAVPGVLELSLSCDVVLGVPSHLELSAGDDSALASRCGVHA